MAKKGKGFFGAIGSFLGSIPVAKNVINAGKYLGKQVLNRFNLLGNFLKKLKKKVKKKIGNVFTMARKFIRFNIRKFVKWCKRTVKKGVLLVRNFVQKVPKYYQKGKQKVKEAYNQAVKEVKAYSKEAVNFYKSIDTMEPFKPSESMSKNEKLLLTGLNMGIKELQRRKGMIDATIDVVTDTFEGLKGFVKDPIGVLEETGEGLMNIVLHPVQTTTAIKDSVKDSIEKDYINGNAYSRAYWETKTTLGIVKGFYGKKGAGLLNNVGDIPSSNNGIIPDSSQPNPNKDPKKPEENTVISNGKTEPSLEKGGEPKGEYAGNGERGPRRQNETADLFAKNGYDIEMLDEVDGGNGYGKKTESNPDYLIEGKPFDCYSPDENTSINNVSRTITKKTKNQAERIVLNLDDYPAEKVNELKETLIRKANPNGDLKHLQELFIVKDGEITRLIER
ncbi:hypothetical protein [Lysinibacillus sp. RS5]|uniref:CdiA C-terminal domain-containing protein n=1 Tax=unclassified Lysinibacillus TaxID=2636778 RepID=UPI0035BE6C2A